MSESRKTVLCIDNDRDTCDLIKFVFQEEGFEVIVSNSPEEGLLQARKGKFGAVILDNRFESLSGVETCKKIRSFDSKIPIIFFSGEARQNEIDKALFAGADAYLTKPIGFEKLTETTLKLIGENQFKSAARTA
jgi:DNA-binding response OmpR family regulator